MDKYDEFKCAKLRERFTYARCLKNQREALEFWGPNASRYQSCPCDQGREIRQKMEGTMSARAICKNCEREMAIMQDGMCGGCFNRARGLKGETREKALAQAREDFKDRGPLSAGNRVPRKPKVEGKSKTDPASGAIAPGSQLQIGGKVEGTSTLDITIKALDAESVKDALQNHSGTFLKQIDTVSSKHPGLPLGGDDPPAPAITPPGPQPSGLGLEPAVGQDTFVSIIINFDESDMPILTALQDLARKFRRSPDQQILWMIQHGIDYYKNLLPKEAA